MAVDRKDVVIPQHFSVNGLNFMGPAERRALTQMEIPELREGAIAHQRAVEKARSVGEMYTHVARAIILNRVADIKEEAGRIKQ